MSQSKEFPQYKWSTPKSWTSGRKTGQPSVIFIHTTEGSEGRSSAEDGAAYDARRTDGTSTHFFVDQDSTVQEVYTYDEAHAARTHGNDVGIQIEVCGKAGQSAAQWADEASAGAIEQCALLAVALRKKYGAARFPLINLTPAQLAAGGYGFAEHRDATFAWPQDHGTHEDPGPNFPWAKLFARIRQMETPVPAAPKPSPEDQDMADPKTIKAIADAVLDDPRIKNAYSGKMQSLATIISYVPSRSPQEETWKKVDALTAEVNELKAALAAMADNIAKLVSAGSPQA